MKAILSFVTIGGARASPRPAAMTIITALRAKHGDAQRLRPGVPSTERIRGRRLKPDRTLFAGNPL